MTLPFVSYGGTSVIVCFVAIGILYRISEDGERVREAKPKKARTKSKKARTSGRAEEPPERPASLDRRRRNRGARNPRTLRGG